MTRRGVVPLKAIARSKNLRAGNRVAGQRHTGIDNLSVDRATDVMLATTNASAGLVDPLAGIYGIALLSGHLAKKG